MFDSSHLSALVPEELASVLYDLFIGQQAVGLLLTQSEDLPQGDTKCPDVTGCGELTLESRGVTWKENENVEEVKLLDVMIQLFKI